MLVRPDPTGLSAARHSIRAAASKLAFSKAQMVDLQLAAGEAISNAFRHGVSSDRGKSVRVSWRFADDTLTVAVSDDGPGFSPGRIKRPGRTNGLGMKIMRACADDVRFEFDKGATVILTKRVGTADASHGPWE